MTAFTGRFLAIDWGTTNRRTYLIDDGRVISTERDDHGVTSISRDGFPQEIAGLRERFGDLPVLMAGMVGSNVGWRVAPYIPVPAGIDVLARSLFRIDGRTAIVPGLSYLNATRADVMRGEEVQLLGAVVAGLVPPDALLAQPGTHCKWVTMAQGEVSNFTTSMNGELFALLRGYGLLASQLGSDVTLGDAFRAGVEEGRKCDLAASLFGIRASKLLGRRDDADAASFASGLIIGADVTGRMAETLADTVYILDDSMLGTLYATAVQANGREARIIGSREAFAAGIIAIGARA